MTSILTVVLGQSKLQEELGNKVNGCWQYVHEYGDPLQAKQGDEHGWQAPEIK